MFNFSPVNMQNYLFLALVLLASQSVAASHSMRRTLFSGDFSMESAAPTFAPTVAPSSVGVATIMTFSTTQELVNCDATTFAASSTSQNVFKTTVAETVSVTADDVTITSIEAYTAPLRRRLTTDTNTTIAYNITLDVTQSSYSSSTAAYTAISTTLVSAVNDGSFATTLQANGAASSDPTQFSSTTSGSIAVSQPDTTTVDLSPTAAPTNAPSSSSKKAPVGMIVGIVIGVLALCVLAYFFGAQALAAIGCIDSDGDLKMSIAGKGSASNDKRGGDYRL